MCCKKKITKYRTDLKQGTYLVCPNMQSQRLSNPFVFFQVRLKAFTKFITKFIKPMLNLPREENNQARI